MFASRARWSHNGDSVTKLDLGQRLIRLLPRALTRKESAVADSSDAALLSRLAAAEPAAVEQLYRAHHLALRAYAQRLIGEPAAAEDLVHDVFVSLPSLVSRFRGQGSLRGFLMGVTTHLSARYVSKARRRRALLVRFSDAERTDWTTPESECVRGQQQTELQRVLDVLPFAQRAAFVLCELEDHSAREASQILGVPEATVRTRCFHARKKLSEQLQKKSP